MYVAGRLHKPVSTAIISVRKAEMYKFDYIYYVSCQITIKRYSKYVEKVECLAHKSLPNFTKVYAHSYFCMHALMSPRAGKNAGAE